MSELAVWGLLIWNVVVCVIFGLDKWLSIKDKQRISEFTLLFLAFAFAGIGALFGMIVWNHKILKWKFRILIPIAIVWQMFSMGYGYVLLGN